MKSKILALMVLLCVLVAGQTLDAQSKGKVLMILRTSYPGLEDLMLTKEAQVIRTTLNKAGFQVLTATATGELIKGSKTSLQPDVKLDDVRVSDYVGVIVPCMGSNDLPIPRAVEIVEQAWQLGKPLAAQNGGVFTLAAAGVLKGRRFTCQPEVKQWAPDGIYAGIGVVVDGKVVTSGTCPNAAQTTKELSGNNWTNDQDRSIMPMWMRRVSGRSIGLLPPS